MNLLKWIFNSWYWSGFLTQFQLLIDSSQTNSDQQSLSLTQSSHTSLLFLHKGKSKWADYEEIPFIQFFPHDENVDLHFVCFSKKISAKLRTSGNKRGKFTKRSQVFSNIPYCRVMYHFGIVLLAEYCLSTIGNNVKFSILQKLLPT